MVLFTHDRIELIWYNPQSKVYECGPWIRYNNLTSRYGEDGFSILYETDGLTARLAKKIVSELNAARVEDYTSTRLLYA